MSTEKLVSVKCSDCGREFLTEKSNKLVATSLCCYCDVRHEAPGGRYGDR